MEREPVGYHLHPTVAYSRSGVRPLAGIPAPFVGQHTEQVMRALGLSAEEIAALTASGVTGKVALSA